MDAATMHDECHDSVFPSHCRILIRLSVGEEDGRWSYARLGDAVVPKCRNPRWRREQDETNLCINYIIFHYLKPHKPDK